MKRQLAIATAILATTAFGAMAEDDLGKSEYMIACAGCHGESGMGNGPFSELMNIETPSLATLAAQHEGKFPFLDTLMVIDGRTGVRGHGGPMPVWGDRYRDAASDIYGPYGSEAIVRGRLLSLVYYLESIQE